MTPCKIEHCEKPVSARGYCAGHYNRDLLGKPVDVELGISHKSIPLEVRFWSRVRKTETCWLWTGPLYDGYGRIKRGRTIWPVHRMAWVMAGGEIPEGMQIDHKCRNRACVRVSHLQVVTQALNAQNRGAYRNSKTGVRGVAKVPNRNDCYRVRATDPITRERIEGGFYEDLAEAEAAAIELRNRLMTNNLQDRMAG